MDSRETKISTTKKKGSFIAMENKRTQLKTLWNNCAQLMTSLTKSFEEATGKYDIPITILKDFSELVEKIDEIEQIELHLFNHSRDSLEWMITQLEWKHREQLNLPPEIPIQHSEEMNQAFRILGELK